MMQADNFTQIWERVKKSTDISSYVQLANIVGTTHQYVSRKKAKNEFPAGWAFIIAQQYGISTDWIMTGKGPKERCEGLGINPLLVETNDLYTQKDDWKFYEELEQWAKETGRSENIQWLRNQIESFYPMFIEWKKRRAEGEAHGTNDPKSRVA